MATASAATPHTAAATCSSLAGVEATPGGSFGAIPATTMALPAAATSRSTTGETGAATVRHTHARARTSAPTATIVPRTTAAYGWPGEARRLTVS